jgi:hypothetical protein
VKGLFSVELSEKTVLVGCVRKDKEKDKDKRRDKTLNKP